MILQQMELLIFLLIPDIEHILKHLFPNIFKINIKFGIMLLILKDRYVMGDILMKAKPNKFFQMQFQE